MKFYIFSGASALALGACSYYPTPLPIVTDQQAASNASVFSQVQYQDPLAGYTYRAPTGPRDWRSVNEEQTEGN
jgi:hypothetical protein